MAEGKPRDHAAPDPEPTIAAADFLYREDPAVQSPKSASRSSAGPSSGANDVFDLVEQPESPDMPPASPTPPIPAAPQAGAAARPRERTPARPKDQSHLDPSALVEQVWSRTAEWGPTLIVLAVWVAMVLFLEYFFGSNLGLGLAFLGLLLGGAVAAVLSYPIVITLERPVRVTPEQAVRDYYAALSHHFPHFRRMWLLLSTAGRVSTGFGSFEGFKTYWKDRLGRLRVGHAGRMTPLVFVVADFKSEKSAGVTRLDADFTLKVSVRGRRQAGPIHKIPMRIALVRGPDSMWYLENGTLAGLDRTLQSSES